MKLKLDDMKISKRYYSINGSNTPNTYIFRQVYNYWECYYLDERGGVNDYHRFNNEDEACMVFLEALIAEITY